MISCSICLSLASSLFIYPAEYLDQVAALPKLETLVVGGLTFTDEDLDRLKEVDTLRGLVLDSTSVTDDGIGALNQTLPALAIRKSQRRAIVVLRQLGDVLDIDSWGTFPQLRRLFGAEHFRDVTYFTFQNSNVNDAGLASKD